MNKGIIFPAIKSLYGPFINDAVFITASENKYTFSFEISMIVFSGSPFRSCFKINSIDLLELDPDK